MCRYQHYLEKVLEASEGYHEVADLMARDATLASTHADLNSRLATSAAAAEAVRCAQHFLQWLSCRSGNRITGMLSFVRRNDLQEYRKTKADELVNLNNSVAVLKEQLERVREESRALDAGRSTRAAATSAYKLEHGQVRSLNLASHGKNECMLRWHGGHE